MHVLTVERGLSRFVLTVESDADADVGGGPSCGVVAVGHGRRRRVVADAPCFGVPVRLVWLARLWRCREPVCPTGVFTERHDLVPPRAKVTTRAAAWAIDALTFDDTTVSALARHLGDDWHTLEIEVAGGIDAVSALAVAFQLTAFETPAAAPAMAASAATRGSPSWSTPTGVQQQQHEIPRPLLRPAAAPRPAVRARPGSPPGSKTTS
jgi:hypothetical protein